MGEVLGSIPSCSIFLFFSIFFTPFPSASCLDRINYKSKMSDQYTQRDGVVILCHGVKYISVPFLDALAMENGLSGSSCSTEFLGCESTVVGVMGLGE